MSKTSVQDIISQIKELNKDGCQSKLSKIRAALESSEYLTKMDKHANDELVKKEYIQALNKFTEEIYNCVVAGQEIPVDVINEVCRFMYRSYRHCFTGFMGFERITQHYRPTLLLDRSEDPYGACVHAIFIIRKYINGSKMADVVIGRPDIMKKLDTVKIITSGYGNCWKQSSLMEWPCTGRNAHNKKKHQNRPPSGGLS